MGLTVALVATPGARHIGGRTAGRGHLARPVRARCTPTAISAARSKLPSVRACSIPTDPWSRYAWIRALAAVDPDAARREMAGIEDPAALKAFPEEDRARLDTALGYLCLDLGIEPLAAMYFDDVPDSASSHSKAQAGLAITRRAPRKFAPGA